jgi:hypothetical protein
MKFPEADAAAPRALGKSLSPSKAKASHGSAHFTCEWIIRVDTFTCQAYYGDHLACDGEMSLVASARHPCGWNRLPSPLTPTNCLVKDEGRFSTVAPDFGKRMKALP